MFLYNHPVVSRLSSLTAVLLLLGGGIAALHLSSHSARAQAPPNPTQPSKAVEDLLLELDDLDTLHILLPLKLTPEQMDKLIPMFTTAKTDFDKKSAALTSAALLKMADEIRATRKKAIAGTAIPTEFDDRVKAIQMEVAGKRKELDTTNIVAVSNACKTILNADQYALCAKMETDAYKRNKRYNDKATVAQYFNAYVMDAFIANPRTIPLLKEMRAAQPEK